MIAIIDYGVGNLRSVEKAFAAVGEKAVITREANVIRGSSHVVLPGVGAFRDAMTELGSHGLVDAVKEAVASDKPFLGICLGMQLLFEKSYEDGEHAGLGILPGEITGITGVRKVPHMGWNALKMASDCPLFFGLTDPVMAYFVHSYYLAEAPQEIVAAKTDYGRNFVSAVWRGNLFATQFHPEKSGVAGLKMLKNFAELSGGAPC
ncbi:imidazole glycerol phosphate synthase subunit HisH [Gehongia tenuis]|uniref:Imidazole glycerol phosphate synthase subunit HisH n=1 Tax=Gehongia tenuis TaxID=2763655 RepID=A0A926D4H0_9FIRM|nr:imidazole glycerol phosphate synthase subunit HisH [Gehongia tenuis]MBC8531307.1 imidazole glycerol phosphate synthase subunit HisH [Gehongia tenuis]